jgi:hypothetical protein
MYLCVKGIDSKPVPSQESERSCICVLRVSIVPLSTILIFYFTILIFYFGIVLTAMIFFLYFSFDFYRYIILIKMVVFALLVYFREFYPTFYVLSYYVSLRSEFRVVMSLTISVVRYVFTSICL